MRRKETIVFVLITSLLMIASVVTQSSVLAQSVNAPIVFKSKAMQNTTAKLYPESSVNQVAKKLLNTPYKPGGTTPKGFDASGFTQYVFKNSVAKMTLPRTVADQYKQGIAVKQTDLVLGDLVFFKINRKLQSVGIYTEYNEFYTVTSKGVKKQSFETDYWKKNFYGAKRIIQPSGEAQKLILNMYALAKQGKITGAEFGPGTKEEEILQKWGKPDAKESWESHRELIGYEKKGFWFVLEKGIVESIIKVENSFSIWDVWKVLGAPEILGFISEDGIGRIRYDVGKGFILSFSQYKSSFGVTLTKETK